MEIGLTWIDLAILGVVIASALMAAARGFVHEVLGVFAWAAAGLSAIFFFPRAQPVLRESIQPDWLADGVTLIGIFLIVLIPLSFVATQFGQSLRDGALSPLDKVMGGAYGLIRGVVLIGIAYAGFTWLVPKGEQPGWLTSARLFPAVQATRQVLVSLVPPEDEAGRPAARADAGRERRAAPEDEDKDKDDGVGYREADRRALDQLIESRGRE